MLLSCRNPFRPRAGKILASLICVFATALALSSCLTGDGVPRVYIVNELGECMVEASFLGYGFVTPIDNNGNMADRDVVVKTDYAYAITMEAGGRCPDMASKCGGKLWITKDVYTPEPGKIMPIRFSPSTARHITPDAHEYYKGPELFPRLLDSCASND